jgi:lipopolysaccharide export system protein LptC
MRRRLISAGLLAVAVFASLAVWEMRPKPQLVVPSASRSDYILENFELTSLDENGMESFSVKSPHLERDPSGKSLTIKLPEFSFPDDDGGRWQATSNLAWVAEKGVEVRLIDKVDMLGPPSPLGERTRFNTEHLQIFPKQNLAQSQDPVTISRADSILHGTGLRADMQTHHIQLLANVKGRYAPRRP